MKAVCISSAWVGGVMDHFSQALAKAGIESKLFSSHYKSNIYNKLKLHQIEKLGAIIEKEKWEKINKGLQQKVDENNPDIIFIFNSAYLYPETIKKWHESKKHVLVLLIGDYPFDNLRFKYFPYAFRYFHYIFSFDEVWIPSIRRVAPESVVEKMISGYSDDLFKPTKNISPQDIEKLGCELAFTGESYGRRVEGAYRISILSNFTDYNLKIWGDNGWKYQFKYHPELEPHYIGGRLPYDDLKKLYRIAKINLNMPSPQVMTSFQPRVLEIGACKGFQIVDDRKDLRNLFKEGELVTFENIPDLKEKINHYLKHPEKANEIVEKFYQNVIKNHTWTKRVKEIMQFIR